MELKAKIPISVIIPVKNEERNIGECISRVKDYSEVIVVDSYSTDRTREIVIEHSAKLVDFNWNGRFPKKRNWALENLELRNDWVLFLDADEYVCEEFNNEVSDAIRNDTASGFWIRYNNVFMGKLLRHGDKMRKLSLFRKEMARYEQILDCYWTNLDMEVHEHPVVKGNVYNIITPILHHDFKSFDAYISRHNNYSTWEAKRYLQLKNDIRVNLTIRQRIKYQLINSWLLGPLYFIWTYFIQLGLLDGKPGLIFSISKMCYFLQIKSKIEWELLNRYTSKS